MPILCGNDVRSFLLKIISIFYCSGVKSSVKKLKSTTDWRRGLYPNSEALGLALEHYRKTRLFLGTNGLPIAITGGRKASGLVDKRGCCCLVGGASVR